MQLHGEQESPLLMSLGLRPWVSAAYDLISVRWDGRRFFSRGALKLHLDWSGGDYETWVRAASQRRSSGFVHEHVGRGGGRRAAAPPVLTRTER